jgi:RNA polymerase sigma factor for flagellar operon FliA
VSSGPSLPYARPVEWERGIAEFVPIIRYLAERLAFRLPPHLTAEDLVQVGVIGLMDAMEKYDPARETKFKTYATVRIRGAMLDEIRSLAWVPRSIREKIGLLNKTTESLAKRLGRAPSEEEMATALGMDVEQFGTFLSEARPTALLSLEDLGVQGEDDRDFLESVADPHAVDPLDALVSKDMRARLLAAIDGLPEKERLVVSLYYVEDLTMKEVGRVLKITESRVCQLHTQAIVRLKGKLAGLQDPQCRPRSGSSDSMTSPFAGQNQAA